jgi:hypothetical protein
MEAENNKIAEPMAEESATGIFGKALESCRPIFS